APAGITFQGEATITLSSIDQGIASGESKFRATYGNTATQDPAEPGAKTALMALEMAGTGTFQLEIARHAMRRNHSEVTVDGAIGDVRDAQANRLKIHALVKMTVVEVR